MSVLSHWLPLTSYAVYHVAKGKSPHSMTHCHAIICSHILHNRFKQQASPYEHPSALAI